MRILLLILFVLFFIPELWICKIQNPKIRMIFLKKENTDVKNKELK